MSSNSPTSDTSSDDDLTVLRTEKPVTDETEGRPNHSRLPSHLTILDLIDQGGIGSVHLAYDETIGRRVAVKELLDEFTSRNPANTEVANTFIHEAKITGKLEHPGIVPVYELGRRNDGQPYYVMRYIKGETLERSLKKCAQTENETAFARRLKLLDSLITACDAVAYAHAKGVIHRDLKPANIISGSFGETIVLDWGLAQVVEDNDNTYFYREVLTHQRHTLSDHATSEVMGTPAYMAPEQFRGITSKASDVYSLGVILYRILTGTFPYHGSLTEIQNQIESPKASPSVRQANPSAQPELIAICEKAMRKQPEERFADAGELAAQLKAFREGRMVNIYAYSKQELLRRFLSQHKTMIVMVGLLFITIICGSGFSVYYAKQMKQAKTEAEESLILVTTFSERSQQQARAIARAISSETASLYSDLNQVAAQISVSDSESSQKLLAQLHNQYPEFESFSLRNATEASTAFSKDGVDRIRTQQQLWPIAQIENKRLILTYRVPVLQDGLISNYLEARMYPEKALPDFFPLNTQSETHPRNIWIMREDGLIIFDESSEYIATNLFIDSATSPSLQAFGRLMLIDDDSIGYYSFIDSGTEISKIAAWDSINFGPTHSWKVVVNYTYMRKKTAAPSWL